MKRTAKKTLSLLLTAVLMLGLLSVGALADNDPIAGLAGLGEFTPPETNGQENPLAVPETDLSVNPPAENQGGNAVNTQGTDPTPVPETVPDDGKLRIYTTDKGMHLTIDGTTGVEPAVPVERELQVYGSDRTVTYDPQKRIGVMISKIGASKAISVGAYDFALAQLDV